MSPRTSALDLLLMLAGFAIWGAAFNVLYGTLSLGCELAWHERMLGPVTLQRALLVTAWALHLALHALLLVWLRRRAAAAPAGPRLAPFVRTVAAGVAAAGLAATFVTGALPIFLTPCAP